MELLIFLAAVAARMIDPIAIFICVGAGVAIGRWHIAAVAGGLIYSLVMLALGGGVASSAVAGALLGLIGSGARALHQRRKAPAEKQPAGD
jgi:predicted membrane protein